MEEFFDNLRNIPLKTKRFIITLAIIIIVSSLILLSFFIKGYISAKEKSEQKIAELEAEIQRLSDPAAVYEEAAKEINISLITSKIQEIGELATIEYLYTDAGKFSDPKQLFGHDIPFTTKSFIAKWNGSIKAGVKVDKITVEIDDSKKEILIHIPKAEILSYEIDNDSFETLDEKDGLFNPIKIDDIREFDAKSKEAMEQRAIDSCILDKAFENAKNIILNQINTDAVKKLEYNIIFQVIEESEE